MNKKLASLLFALLVLFLIATLVITYILISDVKVDIDKASLIKNDGSYKLEKSDESGWVEKLTKTKLQDYSLPATEISVKLSLNDENIKKYQYRVLVENASQVQFFNLTQILQTNNINYSYFKQENSLKVIILTDSKPTLDMLLNKLEDYSIDYTLEK